MFGEMARDTQGNGYSIKCTERDILYGQTGKSTLVTFSKIKGMVKANLSGKMEESMMELGARGNSMEWDCTETQKEKREKGNGWMASGLNGWIETDASFNTNYVNCSI